jgi:hypothetical protein
LLDYLFQVFNHQGFYLWVSEASNDKVVDDVDPVMARLLLKVLSVLRHVKSHRLSYVGCADARDNYEVEQRRVCAAEYLVFMAFHLLLNKFLHQSK